VTSDDAPDREAVAQVRREGRALVVALHGATRVMKLYPAEHQAVQRALSELVGIAQDIQAREAELDFRAQGEFLFINGTRLRLDLTNYASFGHVLSLFREADVGALRVASDTTPRDWLVLLTALTGASGGAPEDRFANVRERLVGANVTAFVVESALDTMGDEGPGRGEVQAVAKRTYSQSVAITKDVINSVRMGRAPSIRKLKRAVQGIVDQVLNEETTMLGITTLREYDEYTYTHSVNVCIFSVALGKRLAMTKLQLYELGIAALLHDIGKSRVPAELIRKDTGLEERDWRTIMAHPWLGMLVLFQFPGQHELPYRAMAVAHEHHMKCDLTGYPKVVRPRTLGITSRIVAVADSYDAATSRRAYQTVPYPPSAVLQEIRDNPSRGMDPVVVKAFINLLGIYPVGTVVVLDTFELGIVEAANTDPALLSRPSVIVVSDEQGQLLSPPYRVDLAARTDDGQFARTIIKTTDPDRYGIRVSDYLL
jgi:HD-GYP domain-containing protein (c-di-GMP phosphodiesterase class II)